MLAAHQIEVNFGDRVLFDGISFVANPGDRIGLIGRNGAGKSTLLKIITKQYVPDKGTVETPVEYSIGYLTQDINVGQDNTVREEANKAFSEINLLEKELKAVEEKVENTSDFESDSYYVLLDKMHHLNERIQLMGAPGKEKELERVLMGLGFKREELERPLRTFSGGWQMRVELAKILLSKPDLVLLDEPTNHLDIESIQWLEGYLSEFKGAIILVSHDREFLNRVVNRTFELVNGKLYDFRGNFSEYQIQKEERKKQTLSEHANTEKKISQIERNIERFRAKASKAKFAQSLVKKLDKIELPDLEEEDMQNIRFRFPEAPPCGKMVSKTEKAGHSYGKGMVFENVDLLINRHDRVAFVGRNGEGKTTLSRIMAQNMQHSHGEVIWGHNVKVGYYAQHQADLLQGNQSVLEVIENAASEDMRPKARTLLGSFLFQGDDVYKKVSVLSGGEKSRLALAKLLLDPVNFLILDEPTNHLDLLSKEVLKKALLAFNGTLIVVSHDRDFLKGLTNLVFEFKSGNIKEFIGDIYEYLEKIKLTDIRELERKEKVVEVKKEKPVGDKQQLFEEKKELSRQVKKLKNDVQRIEGKIGLLEEKMKTIESELSNPGNYAGGQPGSEDFERYNEVKNRLENTLEEWEKTGTELTLAEQRLKEVEKVMG